MGKFDGKVALVTGGNSGIGLATAKRLAAEGATVYVTGRRKQQLDAAVKEIGPKAIGVAGDVTKLSDLDQLFEQIKSKSKKLDILFANAGAGDFAPLGQITEAHFDKWFAINVKGVLFTVQKALPLMPDGASIILNGSIAGSKGMPAFSVYSATKAAVRSFARSWATDLKDRKIRVNVVAPGPIKTPAIKELTGSQDQADAMFNEMAKGIPLGRAGEPDEIAKVVSFLASDDASYVNGIELFVDGGMIQV